MNLGVDLQSETGDKIAKQKWCQKSDNAIC